MKATINIMKEDRKTGESFLVTQKVIFQSEIEEIKKIIGD